MNKHAELAMLVLVLVFCTGALEGQESEFPQATRVGIGVALEARIPASTGFSNVYVPIVIASWFRIEPEVGYSRLSESTADMKTLSSSLRFGIGILPAIKRGRTSIYVGARLGLVYTKFSIEDTQFDESGSGTDYYAGAAVGAEYSVSSHFGVGAEVQVGYTWMGDFNEEQDASPSAIGNRNLVFVRWYF